MKPSIIKDLPVLSASSEDDLIQDSGYLLAQIDTGRRRVPASTLKTYLLFAFTESSKLGGVNDLINAFSAASDDEAIQTAIAERKAKPGYHYQLVSCLFGKMNVIVVDWGKVQ